MLPLTFGSDVTIEKQHQGGLTGVPEINLAIRLHSRIRIVGAPESHGRRLDGLSVSGIDQIDGVGRSLHFGAVAPFTVEVLSRVGTGVKQQVCGEVSIVCRFGWTSSGAVRRRLVHHRGVMVGFNAARKIES